MLYLGELIALATLVLWIYALVDLATTEDAQVRNLPKLVWLMIVLLLPLAGSIVWLIAGRPVRPKGHRLIGDQWRRDSETLDDRDHGRPVRPAADPVDDAEFLRKVRQRAEEQRRKARGEDSP